MFFSLSSWLLALLLFAIVIGATAAGILRGRALRQHSETLSAPLAALQGALLGIIGLVLAFGLAMSVDRYETRRAAVVSDANAIGTTYLRAQTLPEPMRSRSIAALRGYLDETIRLSETVPDSDAFDRTIAAGAEQHRDLWSEAGSALRAEPDGSAVRLYVESLNQAIDMRTVHVAALRNRVPVSVLALEVIGAAAVLGLLGLYLAVLGRGIRPVLVAAAIVSLLLLVTFDLDRPTRGLIEVPDTPLVNLRTEMALPPAATLVRP